MILNGTNYRNVYQQTGLSWALSFVQPYTTGDFRFSFSGESGNSPIFSMKNGKIFDPYGGLIGSYGANVNLSLSGNISSNKIDLYSDSKPLYLGLNRVGAGKIYNAVADFKNNSYIDFKSVSINGDIPIQLIGNVDKFFNFKSGDIIQYPIVNNSDGYFFINSGQCLNSNFSISGIDGINGLPIYPRQTGYLYVKNITDQYIGSDQTIPIVLYTNAGTQNIKVNVSGISDPNTVYYILLDDSIPNIFDGTSNIYRVSVLNPLGTNLLVNLSYSGGITGNYYAPSGLVQLVSGKNVSGLISGTGYLKSFNVTGKISGYNNDQGVFSEGSGTGHMYQFKASTNEVIYPYRIRATGIGDSIDGFYGILGTCYLTGVLTGNPTNGYLSSIITGNPDKFDDPRDLPRPLGWLPTGSVNATTKINYFPDRLNPGDYIRIQIQGYDLSYVYDPDGIVGFTNIDGLISELDNWGAVTINNNIISMSMDYYGGELGNSTLLSSYASGGLSSGSGFLIPYPAFTGGIDFYPPFYISGGTVFSGRLTVPSTGYYTGTNGSGYLTGTVNVLMGQRNFNDVWNISTGVNNNFTNLTFINGSTPMYSGSFSSNSFGRNLPENLQLAVSYSNSLNVNKNINTSDRVAVKVSGINFGQSGSGFIFDISG